MSFFSIQTSQKEGSFGPGDLPSAFLSIPFSPFSKTSQLGRAAELTQQGLKTRYPNPNNPVPNRPQWTAQQNSSNAFGAIAIDEEDFHIVDSRPALRAKFAVKKPFQPKRGQWQATAPTTNQWARGGRQAGRGRGGRGGMRGGAYTKFGDRPQRAREWSAEVKADWVVMEEINYLQLAKLSTEPGETKELAQSGPLSSLPKYDKALDRVTAKAGKAIPGTSAAASSPPSPPTASDDPVMQDLAERGEGDVFVTDDVIAQLMVASRSMNSWDVVVTKENGKIFLDKRVDSDFDYVTVSETSNETLPTEPTDINSAFSLSREATRVNNSFKSFAVDKTGSTVYSYKLFTLGDGMRIVIRCALETVATVGDSERVALVRSLLEHEGRGTDWRGKLDSAKGAVIVTEIRNNACKMAKWTAQAVLAGADGIRVGFVARQSPKNPSSHVLLGTNYYRTKDFASSINLNMNNAWGIIKALLISFAKLGDGKFLFLKDPTKPILRLYAVPKEYFESVKLD